MAQLYLRLLGAIAAIAFLSLLSQLQVLLSSRGLRPVADLLAEARADGEGLAALPTLFWLSSSDAALGLAAVLGALLCVLAAADVRSRICLPAAALIYVSFAVVGDAFLAFQWDNMLVELLVLAAFLPGDRAAPGMHLLMRVMLFKLYFESGIAKWQSHLGDWQDGSAMTFYYETAPIPAPLAWYAHHLPQRFHHLESWLALVLELVVPLLIFGPRRARMAAFLAFTGFQVINTATANYGFFTYLSLALHLFLLSDDDLRRVAALRLWPRRLAVAVANPARGPQPPAWRALSLRVLAVGWLLVSLAGAAVHFGGDSAAARAAQPLYGQLRPLRIANVYHLFGHITRLRIEPQFETLAGGTWTAHDLRYKPGDVTRPPPIVAPHQPRVDFRLWFYGLGHRRGTPAYVRSLLHKLCRQPDHVQPLFAVPLPARPEAVRIQMYRYRFTSPQQRARTGAVWERSALGVVGPLPCVTGE